MSYELVTVVYTWKDNPEEMFQGVVCIGDGKELQDDGDDEIFFYVKDRQELAALTYSNNGEDFVILEEDE